MATKCASRKWQALETNVNGETEIVGMHNGDIEEAENIAGVYGGLESSEKNAALISAAPELLTEAKKTQAAITKILKMIQLEQVTGVNLIKILIPLTVRNESVIAKAEGK